MLEAGRDGAGSIISPSRSRDDDLLAGTVDDFGLPSSRFAWLKRGLASTLHVLGLFDASDV